MPPRNVSGSNTGATATVALLVLIAATTLQDADARVKVVGAIPEDYWGGWTTGKEPCKSGDTEILVLSARAYTGPFLKVRRCFRERNTGPKRRYLLSSVAMYRFKPNTEKNFPEPHNAARRDRPDCRRSRIRES
jgi:hypothetical protein